MNFNYILIIRGENVPRYHFVGQNILKEEDSQSQNITFSKSGFNNLLYFSNLYYWKSHIKPLITIEENNVYFRLAEDWVLPNIYVQYLSTFFLPSPSYILYSHLSNSFFANSLSTLSVNLTYRNSAILSSASHVHFLFLSCFQIPRPCATLLNQLSIYC
jgi:hypothetical protein